MHCNEVRDSYESRVCPIARNSLGSYGASRAQEWFQELLGERDRSSGTAFSERGLCRSGLARRLSVSHCSRIERAYAPVSIP
jgi:hypothetical protein